MGKVGEGANGGKNKGKCTRWRGAYNNIDKSAGVVKLALLRLSSFRLHARESVRQTGMEGEGFLYMRVF